MPDTASTTFPKSQPIPERSSRKYRATLKDMDGVSLQEGSVTSIRFSLRDDRSDVVVNARNRVEVLNQNGGSFGADGAFSQVLNTLDTVAIGTAKLQKRRALFEVTYLDGIENHEVFFYIEALEDIPPVLRDMGLGAITFGGLAPSVAVA